jgi:hypothetical protein
MGTEFVPVTSSNEQRESERKREREREGGRERESVWEVV